MTEPLTPQQEAEAAALAAAAAAPQGVGAQVMFAPGVPVNAAINRVTFQDETVLLIMFSSPNVSMGTFWKFDEAIEFANKVREQAGGLTIPAPGSGLIIPPGTNGAR